MKELILCVLKGECFVDELGWLLSLLVAAIIRWIEKGKNKKKISKKLVKRFKISKDEADQIIKNHTLKKDNETRV